MDVMRSRSCRCCLRRAPDRDLATPYTHLGRTEIYSDMLKECFDLHLAVGDTGSCGICSACVGRLRDASDFKLQVQRSQAELQGALLIEDTKPVVKSLNADMDGAGDNPDSDVLYEEPIEKLEVDKDEPAEVLHEDPLLILEPADDGNDGDSSASGSEEDDSDDEEAEELAPVFMPRVARVYLPDDEDVSPRRAQVELSWPPTRPVQPAQPEAAFPNEARAETTPATSTLLASTERIQMEPIAKFDFKWRQIPYPPIPPRLRRESFIQNKGPTQAYVDPYAAFVAILDRPIMEHIVMETNKYAAQLCEAMMGQGIAPNSRITKWVDTSVDELYTYYAIMHATGIVIKSRLEDYWSTTNNIFITPEFSVAMSYDRYCLLNRCLHFNGNALCVSERLNKSEAKLQKLQPIVRHLNDKFTSLYMLGQNIVLDESLTMFKGCLNIKQHIPNRAATIGIKTYEICESETGYLWRFEVEARQFTSSEQEVNPLSGKIPTLVLRLLHGLEHKGHTVWMDNFYNSPALARELKLRGFDCVGTLRTNRQCVPADITNLQAEDMAVGQVCGCTSGDVDIVVWRDKKIIALISTYHGLATVECADTVKPALIADYNICMGGVDKKDQMLAMYPVERNRNRIWYKKFFRRLLNASTLNAFIMLRATKRLTHRKFRQTLVLQLLERHNTNRSSIRPALSSQRHMPQYFGRPAEGSVDNNRRLRRKCVVCAKRTSTFCEGCKCKALCVPKCFSQYH